MKYFVKWGINMEKAAVIVIGGGATGVGILRDLAMRGVDVLLVEKRDLVNGASSRYHGLLHSGARYAVKDQEAAKECIEENQILRRIGKSCVEASGGMFIRLDSDDPDFEGKWVDGCKASGIEAIPITLEEAHLLEPQDSLPAGLVNSLELEPGHPNPGTNSPGTRPMAECYWTAAGLLRMTLASREC